MIIKETCLRIALNSTCDELLFITNSPLSSQNTITISDKLSDPHKMIVTDKKTISKKTPSAEKQDKDWKYFDRPNLKMI